MYVCVCAVAEYFIEQEEEQEEKTRLQKIKG